MSREVNLERRIKKHVKGKSQRIAAICHPKLSDLASNELRSLGFNVEEEAPGVLMFEAGVEDLYRVNLQARLIVSFRIRLMEFRCAAREDLFRKLRSFPWEYWLKADTKFQIKLTKKDSVLSHDGRARASIYKAITGRIHEFFPVDSPQTDLTDMKQVLRLKNNSESDTTIRSDTNKQQDILVHLSGKRAVVSLNSSGTLLYKRGYAPRQGSAPLRETLAAAIIEAAPFTLSLPIIDAMAGSGSFLCEAILRHCKLWPLPQCTFAFENWPVFRQAGFENLRKNLKAENRSRLWRVDFSTFRTSCDISTPDSFRPKQQQTSPFYAVEQDPNIYRFLLSNLGRFSHYYLDYPEPMGCKECSGEQRKLISPLNKDIFTWLGESPSLAKQKATLLCNPPYGWRLPQSSYKDVWQLFQDLPHWQGIVLLPIPCSSSLLPPPILMKRGITRKFPHGGKWIRAFYIRTQL